MSRLKSASKLLAAAVATSGVVTLARALHKRHREITGTVPPELRTPLLYPRVTRIPAALAGSTPRFDTGRLFPLPDGVSRVIRTAELPGREPVAIHLYEPLSRKRPSGVLVMIHGGGYVLGSAAISQSSGGRIALELGVLVVSVEYRLAPTHPFPAPLEDCYTALKWVHQNAAELGIDTQRIAIAGDSAGGGLAAALAQLAHDRAEVPVSFQALSYPMLDDRTVFRSDHGGTGRFIWTPELNRYGWTSYLGQAPTVDPAPEYAVPARREDLSGLPPAWIGVGDLDLFHEENVAYAQRLSEAGVDVELHEVPGMAHAMDRFRADAPSTKAFTESQIDALRRAIG